MNNTSTFGAAVSTSRSRAIRKIALPAATVAGSIVVALGTGIPVLLGGLNPGNHNGTGRHCSRSGGGERQCQPRPTDDSALR